MQGRDVLGIAKTGSGILFSKSFDLGSPGYYYENSFEMKFLSGKTAAYLWPAIVHIMAQRDLEVSVWVWVSSGKFEEDYGSSRFGSRSLGIL